MGMQNRVYYSSQSLEFVIHQYYFRSQYFILLAASRRFLRLFWLTESPRNGKESGGKDGAEAEAIHCCLNNSRGLWASASSRERIKSASCVCWAEEKRTQRRAAFTAAPRQGLHLTRANCSISARARQAGRWVSKWIIQVRCLDQTLKCEFCCCLD